MNTGFLPIRSLSDGPELAEGRLARIAHTTDVVLTTAKQEDVPPYVAAERFAESRLAAVG